MSEMETPAGLGLQFERAQSASPATTGNGTTASCAACHRPISQEYYDINGTMVCADCRVQVEGSLQSPRGMGPLLMAGLFGFGAAVAGAAVYYAVLALANLEIGIVAILTGYMVGYAVHRGAGNRGGRRFQVLAVVLTYLSVAMAYTPLAVQQVLEADGKKTEVTANASGSPGAVSGGATPQAVAPVTASAEKAPGEESEAPTAGRAWLSLLLLAALAMALPVLVVVGSMPSGLISAAIMFFGMHQAWKMTGTPSVVVNGPYRVGGSAVSNPL